ncbi:MAG TPA: tRNA pseudouridine(55) synthase TruB [Longimicrobiales bacterium]|nr:tRNA pseudouridine(55) synthase TruB [Longimicrobiales bacterium]
MSDAREGFVLPVDKPEGPTSHDVVRAARRALGERRIGHTGTLDPFASGLLLLCVGRATRLAEYLSGLDKRYDAVMRLGVTTDTLDREGRVLEEREGWRDLDAAAIDAALARFRGRIAQVPPQYSAKKVGGVATYRRARRGEAVDLAPVEVTVHELEPTWVDLPRVGLRVSCSTGTYVRALARDVGEALSVGAHLESLRRTAIGGFQVGAALPPEALDDPERVRRARIAPLEALAHLPRVDLDEAAAGRIARGGPVPAPEGVPAGTVAVAHAGRLVAVASSRGGALRPRKVLAA